MDDTTAGDVSIQTVAKRRMRNLLLDARFQLMWSLRVAITASLIVAIMGYFLYDLLDQMTDIIAMQRLGDPTMAAGLHDKIIEEAQKDKVYTLWALVGGAIGLVATLTISTILLTHKIAGPMYKMRKLFSSIDGSHMQLWAKLRKGDELQNVFTSFEDMLRRLRENRQDDIAELEGIRELVVAHGDLDDLRERVDEILVKYRDSIKME